MKIWVFVDDIYAKHERDRDLGFTLIWEIPKNVGQILMKGDGWSWNWGEIWVGGVIGKEVDEEWREYSRVDNSFTIDGGYFGDDIEGFANIFWLAREQNLYQYQDDDATIKWTIEYLLSHPNIP